MDTHELKERTKQRASNVWGDINPVSFMGLDNPMSDEETLVDTINIDNINGDIVIVDDTVRIKEEQLADTLQLGNDALANEFAILDSKLVTERTIIAMQIVTNDYIVLIDKYVIGVKDLLADARDYAFEIEKKNIPLALAKAELAEDKAAARIATFDMKIQLEELNRKFVDVEVLRSELNVAKADVRLVMAEIGIEEAELEEVEARVTLAMTDVEKVSLLADVAMIYADIATRALSETKYKVEAADVEAAFGRISSVLAAALATITEKHSQILEQTALQAILTTIADSLQAVNKIRAEMQLDRAESNQVVQAHEITKTSQALAVEGALKESRLTSQIEYDDKKVDSTKAINSEIVDAASIEKFSESTAKNKTYNVVRATSEISQAISRG